MQQLVKHLPLLFTDEMPAVFSFCFLYHFLEACDRGKVLSEKMLSTKEFDKESERGFLKFLNGCFNNAVKIIQEELTPMTEIEEVIRGELGLNLAGFWVDATLIDETVAPEVNKSMFSSNEL